LKYTKLQKNIFGNGITIINIHIVKCH
jgi:hypothetical protein